jgi:O-antigen/teichoic acid export membrane protein
MTLARKTVGGLFWVSSSLVFIKIINFITTVILARLLDPSYFGLIAAALVIINFFEIFRDLGIGTALIYKKDDVDMATNTAFFILPIVAVIFYVISYFIAPFAADFFKESQLEAIIRVLSLIFVIWSFGTLPSILLDKNLEFKKKMIPQIIPKIGYGIASVMLALNGYGVWSLVFGRLVLEVLSVLFIWPVVNWRPSYKFDRKIAFDLINYGKQVIGANILVFLISIVDLTFIGRFLGPDNLGFYSIAIGIASLLTSQVSMVMGRVMFPIYSTIQHDMVTLKKAYVRTMKYVSIIAIPASFGIFIVAYDFIKVIYGDKWLPALAALQVLSFYALNRSLLATTEDLYLAAGKPDVRTKLNFLQLIFMSILMYPLTMHYGILGTSVAALLPSILIVFLTFREAGKIIKESFMFILRPLLPFLVGSVILVLSIELLHHILPLKPSYMLAASVILGSAVYFVFLWLTQKELIYEIKELVTKI